MFTPKQNIQWWGKRYAFSRSWFKGHIQFLVKNRALSDLAMANYAELLIAEFTFLFNHRLCCPDCQYWTKRKQS